jgi:hypothetical protein
MIETCGVYGKSEVLTLQRCWKLTEQVGWDSSVGIATRYRLDGPGIESR